MRVFVSAGGLAIISQVPVVLLRLFHSLFANLGRGSQSRFQGGVIQIHKAPFGWHATVGGKAAGVVRVSKQGDEILLLGDVEVYPEYRKRGVGSQLLRALLEHAQENEVREVFGNVTEHADQQPFLRDWYGSHGFEISDLDGRSEFGQDHFAYKVIWKNPEMA